MIAVSGTLALLAVGSISRLSAVEEVVLNLNDVDKLYYWTALNGRV